MKYKFKGITGYGMTEAGLIYRLAGGSETFPHRKNFLKEKIMKLKKNKKGWEYYQLNKDKYSKEKLDHFKIKSK